MNPRHYNFQASFNSFAGYLFPSLQSNNKFSTATRSIGFIQYLSTKAQPLGNPCPPLPTLFLQRACMYGWNPLHIGRIAGLSLLMAGSALGQQKLLAVDPAQSKVNFTLVDVLHTVNGTFQVQQGDVKFDNHTGAMSGIIEVGVGTGHSGNDIRDRRMADNILDAPHFALATFEPKKMHGTIAPTGDSTVQVDGIFTIHGAPHDMTVAMKVHIDGNHATATTHFVVPYVKWGMKDPSTFVLRVNKEVDIDLTLVGGIAPVSTTTATGTTPAAPGMAHNGAQ